MSENGKVLVIAAILKQRAPFKLSTIVDEVALSRQLVHNHLTRLCDDFMIEKNGRLYEVLNLDGLMTSLIESSDRTGKARVEASKLIYTKHNADALKDVNTMVVRLKGLGLEEANELRRLMMDEIDTVIRSLRAEKKWLAGSTVSPRSARKSLTKRYGNGVTSMRDLAKDIRTWFEPLGMQWNRDLNALELALSDLINVEDDE